MGLSLGGEPSGGLLPQKQLPRLGRSLADRQERLGPGRRARSDVQRIYGGRRPRLRAWRTASARVEALSLRYTDGARGTRAPVHRPAADDCALANDTSGDRALLARAIVVGPAQCPLEVIPFSSSVGIRVVLCGASVAFGPFDLRPVLESGCLRHVPRSPWCRPFSGHPHGNGWRSSPTPTGFATR
jgi:hypothetical protein